MAAVLWFMTLLYLFFVDFVFGLPSGAPEREDIQSETLSLAKIGIISGVALFVLSVIGVSIYMACQAPGYPVAPLFLSPIQVERTRSVTVWTNTLRSIWDWLPTPWFPQGILGSPVEETNSRQRDIGAQRQKHVSPVTGPRPRHSQPSSPIIVKEPTLPKAIATCT